MQTTYHPCTQRIKVNVVIHSVQIGFLFDENTLETSLEKMANPAPFSIDIILFNYPLKLDAEGFQTGRKTNTQKYKIANRLIFWRGI